MTRAADAKISHGALLIDPALFAALSANPRVRVRGTGTWGVAVSRTPHPVGRWTVDVELCETEDYARRVLAPFHSFYDATIRVYVLHVFAAGSSDADA